MMAPLTDTTPAPKTISVVAVADAAVCAMHGIEPITYDEAPGRGFAALFPVAAREILDRFHAERDRMTRAMGHSVSRDAVRA
jgi:hypothetical protein